MIFFPSDYGFNYSQNIQTHFIARRYIYYTCWRNANKNFSFSNASIFYDWIGFITVVVNCKIKLKVCSRVKRIRRNALKQRKKCLFITNDPFLHSVYHNKERFIKVKKISVLKNYTSHFNGNLCSQCLIEFE